MKSDSFVREIRIFLFYSKYLWPLHKKFLGRLITPRCSRCIISEKLSPLNESGICQICLSSSKNLAPTSSNQTLSSELSNLLTAQMGKASGNYDALVMFSGGKDSTYLVHRLQKEFPGLRLLLFTVDNTFMSPIAINNMKLLVEKLDVDHVVYRPPARMLEKMFRYAFLNLNDKGCSGTVDQFDGDFFFDVGRNWASRNGIPLLINGLSKTQIEKILNFHHFESPIEMENQNRVRVAGIDLKMVFSAQELSYWWQGADCSPDRRPRFICPFYAWNPSEEEIVDVITRNGLMPSGSSNPIYTNNQLIPTMAIVDMCRYGYSSFEMEFSKNVRDGKADPVLWRNIFELSEYAAKTGSFISQSTDEVLRRLNLSRADVGIPL